MLLAFQERIPESARAEMETQNKQLQVLVNSLVTENMDLKGGVQAVERKLGDIEKHVQEMRKSPD